MSLKPTAEQDAILDAFANEHDLIVRAGAGTGKTTTMVMMADEEPDLAGLYIAFNKSVVDEAKGKFHRNVEVTTAHSLAYRWMRNDGGYNAQILGKLRGGFVRDAVIAGFLFGGDNRAYIDVQHETSTRTVGPLAMARMAIDAVTQFCQSADTQLGIQHLVRPKAYSEDTWKQYKNELATHVVPAAQRAWEDAISLSGDTIRFTHAHYLKLWSLEDPYLDYDWLMLDEAQDTAPVLAAVLERQDHLQRIWVGDEAQAIYGWTGAVNAIPRLADANPKAQDLALTDSWRFGPAIGTVANRILATLGSEMTLHGRQEQDEVLIDGLNGKSTFQDVDAVLVRTNAGAIKEAVEAQKVGLTPYVNVDVAGMLPFLRAAAKLIDGGRPQIPPLNEFKTWDEFLEFVDSNNQAQGEYGLLVSLIDSIGCDRLVKLLGALENVAEQDADVVISTAHKAKGLEWDGVRISEDFGDDVSGPEALMLLYVACTRARRVLRPGKMWPLTEFGLPVSGSQLRRWYQATEGAGGEAARLRLFTRTVDEFVSDHQLDDVVDVAATLEFAINECLLLEQG